MKTSRRTFIKHLSSAAVLGTVPTGITVAEQSAQSDRSANVEVIYEDEHGQIIRVAQNAYVLRGAKSREDIDLLSDKRDEIIMEQSNSNGEATIQSHSDSGSDRDYGYYRDDLDYEWNVKTDFWAQADNGIGEVEGTAEGYWYGDADWVDNPVDVSITIESHVKANYENRDEAYITVPPGYSVSENETRVTLTHTFDEEDAWASLHHEPGAITFYAGEGNCINWIQQDDRFKYAYDTGEVEWYGTYVRADIGHCWF